MIDDKKKSAAEIVLKGQGAYPRLLFDRKEVILPVVPLNFVAETTFKIISDGYDNVNIQPEIPQDRGFINLKLEFPEGKTLGLIQKKIHVKAVFSHHKAISFTREIIFHADPTHSYSIRVSGTTDNSIFTNFPFIQR